MKKFLLASVGIAVLGLTVPASAADMAVKAPPPAPIVSVYNWSGFYIGANGGWAQSHNCWNFTPVLAAIDNGCRDRSGGVAGGQLGYRWQTNQFVFGLEGQGDWASLNSVRSSLLVPTLATRVKTSGIGLFTGQIGWAWNAVLLYVKGGAAVTGNRFEIFDVPSGGVLGSVSATRWGAAVGVGLEYGFLPNWSIGAEYDHLFMGNSNNTFSVADPRIAAVLNNRISQDVDMVTVRVNYRFGGYGAPVTARY